MLFSHYVPHSYPFPSYLILMNRNTFQNEGRYTGIWENNISDRHAPIPEITISILIWHVYSNGALFANYCNVPLQLSFIVFSQRNVLYSCSFCLLPCALSLSFSFQVTGCYPVLCSHPSLCQVTGGPPVLCFVPLSVKLQEAILCFVPVPLFVMLQEAILCFVPVPLFVKLQEAILCSGLSLSSSYRRPSCALFLSLSLSSYRRPSQQTNRRPTDVW